MAKRAEPPADEDAERREHFCEIGNFLFQFSQLEFTIKARVVALFGASAEDALVVLEDVDTFKLADGLQRLARRRKLDAAALKLVDDACDEFKEINDQRVRVAHGLWATDLTGNMGVGKRPRKKGAHEKEWTLTTPQEIRRLADQCQDLLQRFLKLKM